MSRNSEISLQCYLRTEEPKCVGDGVADDMGNDLFLGGIKFVPNFDGLGNNDQWYEFTGGVGKIQLGVSYQPHYGQSLTIDDFELMTVIGKGSFGKVSLRYTPVLPCLTTLGPPSAEARHLAYLCAQDHPKSAYCQSQ